MTSPLPRFPINRPTNKVILMEGERQVANISGAGMLGAHRLGCAHYSHVYGKFYTLSKFCSVQV